MSPLSHPCRRPVEVDLGQRPTVPLELLGRPGRRGTDPLRKVLRRRWTVRVQVARDHRGNGLVFGGRL